MGHFFIISGGSIEDGFARGVLAAREEKTVIAADAGLEFLYRSGIKPDIAIGDFDSVRPEALSYFRNQEGIQWRELCPMKDDTDTEAAVRLALSMGAEGITLLGAGGSRLDHVLGNIGLLGLGLKAKVPMDMLDSHNRIRMADRGLSIRRDGQFGRFVSLLPYTPSVRHVTLTGFLYPLSDYCLEGFKTIGVSNEIVGEEGAIAFDGGILIVIESRD